MKAIMFFYILFMSSFVQGGDQIGNGGEGIVLNGHLYLLDLVEAGLENDPDLSKNVTANEDFRNRLSQKLFAFREEIDVVARKLTEIAEHDKAAALTILKAIELYNWRKVNVELADIPEFPSTVRRDHSNRVLLAVRKDNYIRIVRERYDELTENNRAALLIHEVIYSLVSKRLASTRELVLNGLCSAEDDCDLYGEIYVQDPQVARDIVGSIFSRDIGNRTWRGRLFPWTNLGYNEVYTGSSQNLENPRFSGDYIGLAPKILMMSSWGERITLPMDTSSNDHASAVDSCQMTPRNSFTLLSQMILYPVAFSTYRGMFGDYQSIDLSINYELSLASSILRSSDFLDETFQDYMRRVSKCDNRRLLPASIRNCKRRFTELARDYYFENLLSRCVESLKEKMDIVRSEFQSLHQRE